jgi:hypothetical protein
LEDRSSTFFGAAEIASIKRVGKRKKRPFRITFAGIAGIGGCGGSQHPILGDPVAPSQVVARIEPQDFQNALRSAEADLASAQAVLANSKAQKVGRASY